MRYLGYDVSLPISTEREEHVVQLLLLKATVDTMLIEAIDTVQELLARWYVMSPPEMTERQPTASVVAVRTVHAIVFPTVGSNGQSGRLATPVRRVRNPRGFVWIVDDDVTKPPDQGVVQMWV